ncbi:DNA-directed RNA polymerase subunit epsilon [Halovivax limisalsi]|uniref:DNA-directed RNA polymerase subunit epsilon n=1 Tax=Halovivax limisalsi TaxID=1453760 RepID=UPI001FFC7B83|nr:DNA-directed RNA polymerase subunit epsilon [Halovivax limisalsi]
MTDGQPPSGPSDDGAGYSDDRRHGVVDHHSPPPAGPRRRMDPADDRPVSTGPGDGSLSRLDAVKDERTRRWDVTTPSATLIGRPDEPGGDVDETVRRLHDERHPAMAGHSARMHRLEKARIAHALANACSLSRWERDRVLGIVTELDLTAFGSQRAVPKVSLVVIRYVVDHERRHRLGLEDREWVRERSPEELESLYDRFESVAEDPRFADLLEAHGLDTTSLNRLDRVLQTQLDEQDLHGAALGRAPHRDPNLPAMGDRGADVGTDAASS